MQGRVHPHYLDHVRQKLHNRAASSMSLPQRR
jgi:hypothetical protein